MLSEKDGDRGANNDREWNYYTLFIRLTLVVVINNVFSVFLKIPIFLRRFSEAIPSPCADIRPAQTL